MEKPEQNSVVSQESSENFSNKSISPQQLSGLQALNYQPLAPTYLKTSRLVSIVSTMILLVILMIAQHQSFFPLPAHVNNIVSYLIYAFATIGLLHYFYISFAYKRKFFAMREQDLSYRCGLVFQKTVTQPILRIQHVELKRGPIDRKVGLACLQVFSAGGVAHTFEIPGLLLENAESMRQFILDHKTMNNS